MSNKTTSYLQPLSLSNVEIKDSFWQPRIEMYRNQTIPYQYIQCLNTGRIDTLKLENNGPTPHPFWDSDASTI